VAVIVAQEEEHEFRKCVVRIECNWELN